MALASTVTLDLRHMPQTASTTESKIELQIVTAAIQNCNSSIPPSHGRRAPKNAIGSNSAHPSISIFRERRYTPQLSKIRQTTVQNQKALTTIISPCVSIHSIILASVGLLLWK